eukprot:4690434-Prymnesium_polylepis.3
MVRLAMTHTKHDEARRGGGDCMVSNDYKRRSDYVCVSCDQSAKQHRRRTRRVRSGAALAPWLAAALVRAAYGSACACEPAGAMPPYDRAQCRKTCG